MHHYTAVSYRSFSPCPAVHRLFQYDVPKEALSYPFLLHQILAFSAYHLAYLQPKCRHTYLVQANQHQNDAINRMRRTLSIGISSINCHALFASSVFVTFSAFAAYPSHEKYHLSFSPIKSILNIFNLIVGMRVVLRESNEDLRKGFMHPVFARAPSDGPSATDASLQPLFEQLPGLSSRLRDVFTMEDDEENEVIISAVTAMCECINQVSSSNVISAPASMRALMLWPVMTSSNYHDMVSQHHPAALVVLAYYCVIIHVSEPSHWYLEGWAEALTSVISEQLVVAPWSELIIWPRTVIRVESCQ
ncbi:fungal Zn binuclear cluster domain containing protein [Colletotrichum incanum]|nr:fungal Zn binuclear cluster domain containing protein [Colletotrichum incanum]